MNIITTAIITVLRIRGYQWISGITFVFFLLLYLMTLPASYVGGYSSIEALSYLTPVLVFYSILMALLVALLMPMMIYLIRQGQKASKSSAAGGLLVGILAPMLCCSPILPILMGFIASLLPTLVGGVGIRLQAFIATHQIELLTAASLLLLFALFQNAKKIGNGQHCKV